MGIQTGIRPCPKTHKPMCRWIKIQVITIRCDLAGEQSVVEVLRTIKVGRGWDKGRGCLVWVLKIEWDFATQRRAFQGKKLRVDRVEHDKSQQRKGGCGG